MRHSHLSLFMAIVSLTIFFLPARTLSAAANLSIRISENDSAVLIDGQWHKARIKPRGQHCLIAPRKCYAIEFSEPKTLQGLTARHFQLASMWQDNGYVTGRFGAALMRQVNLYSVPEQYVALTLAPNVNAGLYTLRIAPKEVIQQEFKAVFIAKRKHFFQKTDVKYLDASSPLKAKDYLRAWKQLSRSIRKSSSAANPITELEKKFNLHQYIDWHIVNAITGNGDFSDELFFYSTSTTTPVYFSFMGWDFDGLFKNPHPLNKILHPFAIRRGPLFSLEEKMDIRLKRNPKIMSLFCNRLTNLLEEEFSAPSITQTIATIQSEISPFLTPEILAPSQLDDNRKAPYTSQDINAILQQLPLLFRQQSQHIVNSCQGL